MDKFWPRDKDGAFLMRSSATQEFKDTWVEAMVSYCQLRLRRKKMPIDQRLNIFNALFKHEAPSPSPQFCVCSCSNSAGQISSVLCCDTAALSHILAESSACASRAAGRQSNWVHGADTREKKPTKAELQALIKLGKDWQKRHGAELDTGAIPKELAGVPLVPAHQPCITCHCSALHTSSTCPSVESCTATQAFKPAVRRRCSRKGSREGAPASGGDQQQGRRV